MPTSHASDSGLTRPSLLSRARKRDEEAWCELVELYGPLIAHWCYRCKLNAHATADCVQDVFAAVSRSLRQFQPNGKSGDFRGWLWTITLNKVRDRLRRERPYDQAIGGSLALDDLQMLVDPNTETTVLPTKEPTSSDDLRVLTARAMEQVRLEFEPKSWQMFLRSMVDQIPTRDVAEQFGVTPATIRKVRSRVMRRLRQQLGDHIE